MPRRLNVLLVDDDPADVELTREALREIGARFDLSWVDDGEKALAYLLGRDPYPGTARPDLILLDLNLPGLDGREVLRQLKRAGELASIPVVVLSTSAADEDVRTAYCLGASCYVVKPFGRDESLRVLRSLEHFWTEIVRLPRKTAR